MLDGVGHCVCKEIQSCRTDHSTCDHVTPPRLRNITFHKVLGNSLILRSFKPDKWGLLHGMWLLINVQSASLCVGDFKFKHKSSDRPATFLNLGEIYK